MKATKEAQAAYNNAIEKQSIGTRFFVVMTEEEHAAMREKVKMDIEKIAQAAGVEMPKTARIVVRRGRRQQQQTGLIELNKILQDIRMAKDHESVVTQTGIATGYANAMCHFDLMSENELKDVIEVIGQAGEKAVRRVEAAK